jgi:hypothetical protein
VLEGYDIEVDGELKIAASIYYHRYLARTSNGPSADHLRELVDALYAVGPDLHERRAAAFAGMLLLGRADDIAPMIEHGDKPLHIRSGTGYGNESDSLMALMCEPWEDVRRAFGADFAARFLEGPAPVPRLCRLNLRQDPDETHHIRQPENALRDPAAVRTPQPGVWRLRLALMRSPGS